MQGRRRRGGIELLEAAYGLVGRQRLDLDSAPAEELQRDRVRVEAAVRAGEQVLKELMQEDSSY